MPDLKVLSFTGNGLIVVHSRIAGTEQQAVIRDAASIGQLAGEIGSTFSVQANGTSPWTLRIQHRLPDGNWEDSLIRLGVKTEIGGTPVQFVESERDVSPTGTKDYADLVLKVERSTAVVTPSNALKFTGNAKLVVSAKTAIKEQRYQIEAAQNPGTLAGTVGSIYNVVANGETPWSLRLQQKEGIPFVDRPMVLGPSTVQGDQRIQFAFPADKDDITLRVEQTITQPGTGDTFGMVRGLVQQPEGQPLKDITVSLFARKARGQDTLLGDPFKTGVDGRYIIAYRRTKPSYNLYVQAKRDQEIVATSQVVMSAGLDEIVDLVVGGAFRGLSDFDKRRQALDPILVDEGFGPTDLPQATEKEVAVLSLRSGVLPVDIVLLKQAMSLAQQTGLSQEIFYGLGRQGIPLALPAILTQDPEVRAAALGQALAAGQIPEAKRAEVPAALAKFKQLSVEAALKDPTVPGQTTLGGLLGTAGLSVAKRKTLVEAYAAHTGTAQAFWNQIRTNGTLTAPEIAKTQFSLQLGVVTQNHLPLVQALQSRGVTDLKGLTQFDKNGWLQLIQSQVAGRVVGVPADLASAGLDEAGYANMLLTIVEDAFPTAMLARVTNTLPRSQQLTEFYTRNPSYEMRSTTVKSFLRTNPTAVDFIADATERAAFVGELQAIERVHRIAPAGSKITAIQTIVNAGIGSAFEINTMGRTAFLQGFEAVLGTEAAERLFARATTVVGIAGTLVGRFGAIFDRAPISVVGQRAQAIQAFPDYESLFGSLDFCSCTHCQSALSPAAYLVDVMHWLDTRPRNAQSRTPLTVMFRNRRADIGTIELSCANTNTPLPYLDLVNEVLEVQVAPGETAPAYQTRGDAADLAAHPEHLLSEAYDIVAGAVPTSGRDGVYPFNLPYNLWLDEARTYLGHLGLPRSGLMEAFFAGVRSAAVVDTAVATEVLQISPREASLIAGAALSPARTPQDYWGLSGDANWITKLRVLSFFLTKAAPPLSRDGMDYGELTDLWKASFVQGAGAVGIWFSNLTCDITDATLPGLVEAHLLRLHRFIRLRRRLGWSAPDLDRAIQVLGGGTLDQSLLTKLAQVRRLQTALRLELPELLTWWGPLDTRRWTRRLVSGRPAGAPSGDGVGFVFNATLTPTAEKAEDQSFYDRLFQSRSIGPEPDPAFHLRADGAALANETTPLADQSPSIAAALGITGEELAKLVVLLPSNLLTLANLSVLYRHVSLARALRLDIDALVSLLALSGINPFDPAHPENAVLFWEEAQAVRASGFPVEELDYILRHIDTKPASLEPEDEPVGVLLLEIRDLLRKVAADNPDPPAAADADQLRERLARELAKVLPVAQLGPVLALVDLDPGDNPPAGAEALIDQALALFLNAEAAKNALARPGQLNYLSNRIARLRFVLAPVVVFRRAQAVRATVIEKLSVNLGLDTAVAAPVLEEFIFFPGPGGRSMVDLFSDAALVAYDKTDPDSDAPQIATPVDFPDQFAAYKRLHKISLVLARFRISKDEVNWVFAVGPARGTLNFQTLPVAPPAANQVQYGAWALLRDAFALRNRAAGGKLFDVFQAAAAVETGTPAERAAAYENLITTLVERTRWNRTDVEFLVGTPARGATPATPSALGLVYPTDYVQALKRVDAAMTAVRRIGLSAATLVPWRTVPTSRVSQANQARDIKQAVRARLGEARWRESTKALRDRLREKQRDALAGWLIAHAGYADVFALFDHLLIDVEMSACQPTSRIKQAIGSVQLFVQRALLNGEAEVKFRDGDAREWQWLKSYRVWEANRKVFLYPENYIEPDLRDDKTPFFKELEEELLQGDLTDEVAERAVGNYLEKLDQVARLEVVAVTRHVQQETNVLHVFARTKGAPRQYFHRQWVDGVRWTPWEKVEVDIEGDHLLAVVHNRRLYLFWLIITEAAVEAPPDQPGANSDTAPPERYFQLRLAWSEHRNGKWSGKRTSTGQIGATEDDYRRLQSGLTKEVLQLFPDTLRSDFFMRTSTASGDLLVEVVRIGRTWASRLPRDPITGAVTGEPITFTIAYDYYQLDRFRLSGCDGTVSLERNVGGTVDTPIEVPLHLPGFSEINYQSFISLQTDGGLVLPRKSSDVGTWEDRLTLQRTPSQFEIACVRHAGDWTTSPFFFQDLKRTFFVVPSVAPPLRLRPGWTTGDLVGPDIRDIIGATAGTAVTRPTPLRPDPRALDPGNVSRPPISVLLEGGTRQAAGNALARGGALLSNVATRVVDSVNRVTLVGADAVTFKPNQLGLQVSTTLVGAAGRLIDVLSPAPGAAAVEGIRGVIGGGIIRVPGDAIADIGDNPIFRPLAPLPFRFFTFYHPLVCRMSQQLNRFGLGGLLDPAADGGDSTLVRQRFSDDFFATTYQPKAVAAPFPKDEFDFSYGGAYSTYNWELFFHIPLMIAVSLTRSRRFEQALRWFHFIFDPTESDNQPAPQRFWKVRPFFELFHGEDVEAGPIHELLLLLQYDGMDPAKLAARDMLVDQIEALSANPFNPHALARLRLAAYQKTVVLRYIDNLIEWGDELFRRDTLESINEATQLYILAARILGRRPKEVSVEPPAPQTFNDLRGKLDAFSNAVVQIEAYLVGGRNPVTGRAESEPPVLGRTLFFCTPPNDKLLADGWNRVEDRLFKIRHCMNIEGVVRQLPLFEPPIDPALLVRAVAAGLDLGSILNDIGGSLPLQRYNVLAQRAMELCNDVRGLGQALLVALEKKDVEAMSLLRADQEIQLLNATTQVRQQQIEEARRQVEALQRSREVAQIRVRYYRSREFMNAAEKAQFALLIGAGVLDIAAGLVSLAAAAGSTLPDFSIGTAGYAGSPVFVSTTGGGAVANVTGKVVEGLRLGSAVLDRGGSLAGILGSYNRREDEWEFLGDSAEKEIEQLDRQILAAEIRVAIAEKELDNHRLQIEQSRQVEEFLRDKFTSEQLYSWMIRHVSSLYFQSYKLAYDVARRAERAWQFELAEPTKTFIQFGYWDGLKKGLLAGDRLYFDIQRMATAYLEENRREYELTRHISLRQLDPVALVALRRDGQCFVRIPEAWFDLDSPGHYMRRIKTVSVTVPSVTGPYVSVRLTLTLVGSSIRTTPDAAVGYARTGDADLRFRDDVVGIQSIVTSRGQDDAGLFETNLRDERYLPFEGAGAISEWRLELPTQFRQFDYETMSDVILHVRYTAREGGEPLKLAAQSELAETLRDLILPSQQARPANAREGLLHLVSVAQESPDAWNAFLHPPEAQQNQTLTLNLRPEVFPFAVQGPGLRIAGLDLFLFVTDVPNYASGAAVKLQVTPPGAAAQVAELPSAAGEFGGLPHGTLSYGNSPRNPGDWTVRFVEGDNAAVAPGVIAQAGGRLRLNPAAVRDLFVAVRYKV